MKNYIIVKIRCKGYRKNNFHLFSHQHQIHWHHWCVTIFDNIFYDIDKNKSLINEIIYTLFLYSNTNVKVLKDMYLHTMLNSNTCIYLNKNNFFNMHEYY